MKIRKANETTYTMVCSAFVEKMEPVFKKNGFEYEVLYGEDIPGDLKKEVDMGGHKQWLGVCCIRSEMNSDDIHELMLRTWLPSKYGRADV